ncbi:YqjF family protein [Streptomyces sp. 7N604]|uniref:YqjF family protein n=1 Tax=Streptomyces sp. 7N604 TaxID=3457415 RepID=UPI003FD20A75
MVSSEAAQRVRVPLLRAQWRQQAFLHWPYPPEDIQAILPNGLVVDQYDGAAWVSLTPFLMADLRPLGISPLPALAASPFPETNLRTYVRAPGGRHGVWFLSIEVGSAMMLAARTVGAPYHLGDLSVLAYDGTVSYGGSRRGGEPTYRLIVRPGATIDPSEREVWLTSRWRAYTHRLGVLWETPIWHEPWSLHEATLEEFHETLTPAAGISAPAGDPSVTFSEGVRHVRLGISRPLRPGEADPG